MFTRPNLTNHKTIPPDQTTNRKLLIGLAVYFLASVILRVTISATAGMDETEHLVKAQVLLLGYGAQLPLYTWLQYLFFQVFGINTFAVSLLKFSLLYATYVCVYFIAEKTIRDSTGATVATLSLFLIPQIVWESYRTLANTVLATLLAALTMLLFLKLREHPSKVNHILFGVLVGFGFLSKYNYIIFLAAIVISGMTIPDFRRILLSKRSILSLLPILLISFPPLTWIVSNLDKATASAGKLQVASDTNIIFDYLKGFGSLAVAAIGYCWPLLILYFLFFASVRPVRPVESDKINVLLMKRNLAVIFLLCATLVIVFRVTYFKERWLQPLFFFLPIFFMSYLTPRISRKRFRGFLVASIIPALMAALVFSGGVVLASKAQRETRLNPPYSRLAEQIRQDGFHGGTIITNDHRIGGNLRLNFKKSAVLVQGMIDVPFDKTAPVLVVWDATKKPEPPEGLIDYSRSRWGLDPESGQPGTVTAPLLHWEERSMSLGYYLITE